MPTSLVAFPKNGRAGLTKHCYKRRVRMVGGAALAKAAKEAFLQNVWHWMEYRGMNAAGLADALGITQSAISNWKQKISFPSPDQYDKIAAVLDMPLFVLLWDPSDPRTKEHKYVSIANLVDETDSKVKAARKRLMMIREALKPAIEAGIPLEEAVATLRDQPEFADDIEIGSVITDFLHKQKIHERAAARARISASELAAERDHDAADLAKRAAQILEHAAGKKIQIRRKKKPKPRKT